MELVANKRKNIKMFSIMAFVIFGGMPIFLTSALLSEVVEEFVSRDASTSTMLNHASNSSDCMGEDFIKCYENVLEYITLGDQEIKVSTEKKAIIVIGLTRVGKSTLTQFLANETNPLTVSCDGTICQLIDDSGDGLDSVVSKTFVPNTVEDKITNGVLTPFYDMPGFDDTRNISVEIANSFFIQKVINNIEQIKIVVVAKHASFSGTETTLKTLLTFLIKFAKDPTKFQNSIVLVSNFGIYGAEDADHFHDIRKHLLAYNESMYGADTPHPDPKERATATAWINAFLDVQEVEPLCLRRAAIFRTPGYKLNGESIRNDLVYHKNSVRMKNLLWNETLFTPVSSDDVGFTLSIEAELFLERANRESDANIKNNLNRFTLRTKAYLVDFIKRLKTDPNKQNMARLYTHMTTLHSLYFPGCRNTSDSSPRECINQIEEQFFTLATEMNDLIFTDINKTRNYLQFAFENIGKEKKYNMEDWVNGVLSVWYETNLFFNNTALDVASEVIHAMDQLADGIHNYVMLEFEKLAANPYQGTLEILNNTVSEILNLEVFFDCSEGNPNSTSTSCFNAITEKTKLIREVTSNNIETDLHTSVTFLQLACSEVKICLSLESWVATLASVKNRIVESLDEQSIPESVSRSLLTQLTDVALKLKFKILQDVPNFVSISDLKKHLLVAKNSAESITRSLENYNSRDSLLGYAHMVMVAYRDLFNASSFAGEVFFDGIHVVERMKIFPWFSPAWINFHRDSLTLPVLLEWRVCEFQSLLFRNLGLATVQVDDIDKVLKWRLANPYLQEGNFDQFWNAFKGLGIEAIRTFDAYREDIKAHITNNEYSRKWINALLDYTIKRDQISCPTIDSGTVKFERKYLTLKFIYECLKNYTVKPSTVVALAENTFFFDVEFKNLGIPIKYQIFVMSQIFEYTRGSVVNLNGVDGEPPKRKPNKPANVSAAGIDGEKGNDGKDGADFIGVYLTDVGLPSSVDITCQGGKGGDGQDGGDGADSSDTKGPDLAIINDAKDLADYQCAAWASGVIQVRQYPNSCNYNVEGYCDVKSKVAICGPEPSPAGPKGIGGSHGLGGSGGYKVIVNVTSSSPSVMNFLPGTNGNRGNDGYNGKKGFWGAVELPIHSRYCSSCTEKVCNVYEAHDKNQINKDGKCHEHSVDKPQGNRALPENHRQKSQNSSKTASNKSVAYPLAEFKPYVKLYLDSAVENMNIFNRQDMTTFLDFVKSNHLLV